MRIAIPTNGKRGLDDLVAEHFGRAGTYTIVDGADVEVMENTSSHMGGTGFPPELLVGAGVQAIICAGLGKRAVRMFIDKGIAVFCGAQGTVSQALASYRDGSLELATEETACKRHEFGDHKGDHQCKKSE